VTLRLLPYWYDAVIPDLARHGCVLVASHGNTLRALVKHLEEVGDDASAGLEVPERGPGVLSVRVRARYPGGLSPFPRGSRINA
jgi:2,3-bisphosphoglycerate-dependent phosphoglycerate mutase